MILPTFVAYWLSSSTGYLPAGRQGISDFKLMFYVYAIQSEVDNRVYVGFTANLDKRIKEHNSGKTKSTKGYIPWKIVYYEIAETRALARKREKYFKSGSGKELLKSKLIPHFIS